MPLGRGRLCGEGMPCVTRRCACAARDAPVRRTVGKEMRLCGEGRCLAARRCACVTRRCACAARDAPVRRTVGKNLSFERGILSPCGRGGFFLFCIWAACLCAARKSPRQKRNKLTGVALRVVQQDCKAGAVMGLRPLPRPLASPPRNTRQTLPVLSTQTLRPAVHIDMM